MTGKELHNLLKTIEINGHKIVLTSLAEKLEMRRQDLNSKFRAKKVDYGFILQIAKALQIDVSVITGESGVQEPATAYSTKQKPLAARILAKGNDIITEVTTSAEIEEITTEQTEAINELKRAIKRLAELTAEKPKDSAEKH